MGGERGLQPVVGAVILIVIVLLLASAAFVFVDRFETEEPAPQVATDGVFYSELDPDTGDATPYFTIRHEGGETIQRENVRAVVTVGGESFGELPTEGPDSGPVRANDELTYNLSKADMCSRAADEFTVRLVHNPSNKLIAKRDVPIRDEVEVDVSDNTVSADVPYRAEITIVGMAASSSSGDELQPDTLNARVVVNRDSGSEYLTPWPDGDETDSIEGPFEDNINRPVESPGISYTTTELSADTNVSLEMRSGKPDEWEFDADSPTVDSGRDGTYRVGDPKSGEGLTDDRFWVDSSDKDENNLILLQDGESVPSYGLAGPHQRSLQDILGSQLDGGELNLDDNDVVALYELNDEDAKPEDAPDPDSTGNPDYNDAVAIIEIEPVEGSATSEPGVLYC